MTDKMSRSQKKNDPQSSHVIEDCSHAIPQPTAGALPSAVPPRWPPPRAGAFLKERAPEISFYIEADHESFSHRKIIMILHGISRS